MEKICNKHGLTSHAVRRDGRVRCRKCNVEAVTKRRRMIKKMAVEYLGGKCIRCGYDKCVDAMDFHHTDPTIKDFNISKDGHTRSWERTREELNKCELLCANCHRETHATGS